MVEKSEVDDEERGKSNINPLPKGYNPKQVEDGVKVLFQVLEKSSKKTLFVDEGQYIELLITAIRIPKVKKNNYRFVLPNGFLKETAEICLFVKNLSEKNREYEDTVRHFKNILNDAGVTCISEVISINQLMQEYKTYEMKRRLVSRFDLFLAHGSVSNWLHGALGKTFHRCGKQPTPVKMCCPNLKDQFDTTIKKTTLKISGKGSRLSTKIGHTKQTVEQICQNIEAFVKKLSYTFPGKWRNVRSLMIKTSRSMSVPLYYSFAHPNTVKVPKQATLPQNKMIPTEMDEITTLPDGCKVMVLPSGEVKVKGRKPNGTIGWLTDKELRQLGDFELLNNDEEEEEVESDERGEELMLDNEENEGVEHLKQETEDYYSDSEEDEACVEAAENAYLKELHAEVFKKDSKRKLESESCTKVKKSKVIIKAKNNIHTDWKVEVMTDNSKFGSQNGKDVKNINKTWKVVESTQLNNAKKNSVATEANVKMKTETMKNKSNLSINNKAKGLVSNFGPKGKVSGSKLGKKKKTKA